MHREAADGASRRWHTGHTLHEPPAGNGGTSGRVTVPNEAYPLRICEAKVVQRPITVTPLAVCNADCRGFFVSVKDGVVMELIRACAADAEKLWEMQKHAFAGLYERYRDTETNPACEPLGKTEERLSQPQTFFYFITEDGTPAGAIRVYDAGDGSPKRISPLFIDP